MILAGNVVSHFPRNAAYVRAWNWDSLDPNIRDVRIEQLFGFFLQESVARFQIEFWESDSQVQRIPLPPLEGWIAIRGKKRHSAVDLSFVGCSVK